MTMIYNFARLNLSQLYFLGGGGGEVVPIRAIPLSQDGCMGCFLGLVGYLQLQGNGGQQTLPPMCMCPAV